MFLHLQAIYANPQKLCDQSGVVGRGGEAEGVLSSDLLLMGIMASDVRLALRGFRDWCEALGLEYVIPENRVRGEGGRLWGEGGGVKTDAPVPREE